MKVIKKYRIKGLKKKEKHHKISARGLQIFFFQIGVIISEQKYIFLLIEKLAYTYSKYFAYTLFFHVTMGWYFSHISLRSDPTLHEL